MKQTNAMVNYFEEKVNNIFKTLPEINLKEITFNVDVKAETVTVNYRDHFISQKGDYYDTITKLLKLLRKVIITEKRKMIDNKRYDNILLTTEDNFQSIKEKIFILNEITEDEAINQMLDLGHNFYLYKDIDRKAVCCIYARNDGEFAVIETR